MPCEELEEGQRDKDAEDLQQKPWWRLRGTESDGPKPKRETVPRSCRSDF